MWGVAVILTVTSADLQFKVVTCRLSSCINGSGVCLCASTEVKSNFCTLYPRSLLRLVRKRRRPLILRVSLCIEMLWVDECEWFMFRSFDNYPLNVAWRRRISASSPGWVRSCVPGEIQVYYELCDRNESRTTRALCALLFLRELVVSHPR